MQKRALTAFFLVGLAAVVMLGVTAVAAADPPAPETFVAVLDTDQEVPGCPPAGNEARGVATFHVRDASTGLVEFKLVANNLPGDIVAAHIHVGPAGVAGPVVQTLAPTPGEENGVIKSGSFTNAELVAAIQANLQNYYVNVHTNVCPAGAIRGQLGTQGPDGSG